MLPIGARLQPDRIAHGKIRYLKYEHMFAILFPATWTAPSESAQGDRRVPMEKLTKLFIAATLLVLALEVLYLMLA